MPIPLVALAIVALPILGKAGGKLKDNDAALIIGGLGALWLINKIPEFPDLSDLNPFPAAGQAAKKTGQELTGGIAKSREETWDEWAFEFDVPFSEKRLPLAPGLVRDRGNVYTTETTGGVAMDIVEPRESWGEFWTELDLPGLDPYDLRDAPTDLYDSTIGRVLR